jgi:hypothetical protein
MYMSMIGIYSATSQQQTAAGQYNIGCCREVGVARKFCVMDETFIAFYVI